MPRSLHTAVCLLIPLAAPWALADSPFDEAPLQVVASPATEQVLQLDPGDKLVDLEVAPTGKVVALMLKGAGGTRIALWDHHTGAVTVAVHLPAGTTGHGLTWHPKATAVFLLTATGEQYAIQRLDLGGAAPKLSEIYHSSQRLRRIVACPTLFRTEETGATAYRVFFGVALPGGAWATHTVTEHGKLEFRALGPKPATVAPAGDHDPPSTLDVPSGLPLSFHPSGAALLWEDGAGAFQVASFHNGWDTTRPLFGTRLASGSVTAMPNGTGVVQWQRGTPGVRLLTSGGAAAQAIATGVTFASTPVMAPDGRVLVGAVAGADGRQTVRAVPVAYPLADVANAWLFATRPDAVQALDQQGGLLQDRGVTQLYDIYEHESYTSEERALPARPFLVTTDVFWELFSLAYEGTFIVRERQQAVPAFWAFVRGAAADFAANHPRSPWAGPLAAAASLADPAGQADPEGQRILALKPAASPVLGVQFGYDECRPRGHYAANDPMRRYFMAMRYLTEISSSRGREGKGRAEGERDVAELAGLPEEVKAEARRWIATYEPFIAPSRAATVLGSTGKPAPWAQHPRREATLFPLSWGFDNEVLLSTVYHESWPRPEQIVSADGGRRVLPSGLDLAAALGNGAARAGLDGELRTYPPLAAALERLGALWQREKAAGTLDAELYDRWLEALAEQWADETLAAVAEGQRPLWAAKRLQTGLASWAALRHATVLVNERVAAEAGEGGAFETRVVPPPRGRVEQDPRTFRAIASLFDALAGLVQREAWQLSDAVAEPEAILPETAGAGAARPDASALRQAILKRLGDTASQARGFAVMAEKQARGEALSPSEYEAILEVGGTAEHHSLIYRSLASPAHGLSEPEPLARIADVAGDASTGILHAALGSPLELDLVTPLDGRRQIAKGAVYSYFELTSQTPLDDAAWREQEKATPRPPWVSRFLVPEVREWTASDLF
jgi:hypothetical protein